MGFLLAGCGELQLFGLELGVQNVLDGGLQFLNEKYGIKDHFTVVKQSLWMFVRIEQ